MKQPHHILAVRIAHPVWTLFLLALALAVDHTGIVRLGLLCSCLHECGHLLVWVLLTRLPPTLIICPTGFCLSLRGVVLTPKQFIILAAAGQRSIWCWRQGALPGCWAILPVTACVISSRPICFWGHSTCCRSMGWMAGRSTPTWVSCFVSRSKPRSIPA